MRRCFFDTKSEEVFIKAGGGGLTPDINQAQVFGWAKRAQEKLDYYRRDPAYAVLEVDLVIRPDQE